MQNNVMTYTRIANEKGISINVLFEPDGIATITLKKGDKSVSERSPSTMGKVTAKVAELIKRVEKAGISQQISPDADNDVLNAFPQ